MPPGTGRCRRLLNMIPGIAERASLAHDSPAMVVFRSGLIRSDVQMNHVKELQATSGRMTLLAPFVEGIRMQPFATHAHSRGSRLSRGGPLLNLAAAFVLSLRALISIDAILGCATAIFSVYLFCTDPGLDSIGTRMDWNLISMAVIFPISQCIGWSFARRERALNLLGIVTALTTRIWSAMHTWVVKVDGKWVPIIDLLDQPSARVSLDLDIDIGATRCR